MLLFILWLVFGLNLLFELVDLGLRLLFVLVGFTLKAGLWRCELCVDFVWVAPMAMLGLGWIVFLERLLGRGFLLGDEIVVGRVFN